MNRNARMTSRCLRLVLPTVLLFTGIVAFSGEPNRIDPNLERYQKRGGVSGNLSSVGSDTLNNLLAIWSEGFRKQYPSVNVQVEGKGSSTAPPALVQGTAQIGPMSREMKAEEIEAFERAKGYKPTKVAVGIDALAVYVNKDNPVETLTLPQLDAIFSKTRKGGYPNEVIVWNDLKVAGELGAYPLSIYGRNSASGTYGFFKKRALFNGDFKSSVKQQPGSASVVLAISEDLAGIGYSGIGYRTSGVKFVKLAKKQGDEAFGPTADNVLKRKYPLSRMLLVYVDKKPHEPLPLILEEFLKYVLSADGQEALANDGYFPLPASIAAKQKALFMNE